LDENRARLVQLAGQILAKAGTAALPGITPLKLGQAATTLEQYKTIETAQSDAQSDATDSRSDLKTLVREITNVRIAIQLAADAEWPHGNPANAAERREFQLPPNRPLRG
jgi:succinyl-CoA synthetase alpha subunit